MIVAADRDAFGHALLDHLRRGAVPLVIERDDGHVDVDGTSFYFAPYRTWPGHERRAMRLARGRVLDIGCGAGRHALHLQTKGLRVTGVDSSRIAATVCRRRGLEHVRALAAESIPAGLGPFDTVLLMGNNLGLLGGPVHARRLLRRLARATTPRARIIGETLDPYRSGDPVHAEYHRLNRARGRMPGLVRIRVRYRRYVGPWFDYLFASREELHEIVRPTGWRVTRFLDSEDARYVAILEKMTS